LNKEKDDNSRLKIVYIRVSSYSQKSEHEKQKEEIQKLYPNHLLIEDIGSGIKLTKRGIKKNYRFSDRR
jgi:predicted site-specific integrase-resolvase